MKSKLSLIMSVFAVAFMVATSANAQRAEKVYLPCHVYETGVKDKAVSLKVVMDNNTGAWLAQGTKINFQLTGWDPDMHRPFVWKIEQKILDGMVPVDGSATLEEPQFAYSYIHDPWSCKAWYLK